MGGIRSQAKAERFMPDWIVGTVLRLALVPGLWEWGRANAAAWPAVMPDVVMAAEVWSVPFISPDRLAQLAVWGAHLAALLLVVGFLTRFVGLALLAVCAVFAWWIAPQAWTSIVIIAGLAFYLTVRGGGALSVDGMLTASIR